MTDGPARDPMTIEAFAAKISWEGGIPDAFDYGLSPQSAPPGDLRDLWQRGHDAWELFDAIKREIQNYLDEHVGDWRGRRPDHQHRRQPMTYQWGCRHIDGTAGPENTRGDALAIAARFTPGAVEIVYRPAPDAPWQRAETQPHTTDQRMGQLAGHIVQLHELLDWRGTRLVELGQHPNPPYAETGA